MSSPFVINIGRQLGSGGREIGKHLAEHFNIAYYDKEILSLAAQESGLRQGLFERSDEKKGFFHSIFHVVQPFFGGGGDFYDNQLSEENLFIIRKILCLYWPSSGLYFTRASTSCEHFHHSQSR